EICDRHRRRNERFRSTDRECDAGRGEGPKCSGDREICDLRRYRNERFRSSDRECDARRKTSARRESGEGGWRKDIAQCASDKCKCYPGNGGIGECSANSCGIGKCSSISCGNWPADRGRQCGGQGGSAEGATGQAAGAADQTAARELPGKG